MFLCSHWSIILTVCVTVKRPVKHCNLLVQPVQPVSIYIWVGCVSVWWVSHDFKRSHDGGLPSTTLTFLHGLPGSLYTTWWWRVRLWVVVGVQGFSSTTHCWVVVGRRGEDQDKQN